MHVDERIALQEDFPGRLLASPQLPPRVTIEEHGVRFRVHFERGHKTGFFCDQRDNRRDLARFCAGQSVLDACCYTGGFGLNALVRGQAREVTCVDLDEKAVALARENGNANRSGSTVVHADAFGYMRQMALNRRSFGVVVLDPPKLILDRDEVSVGQAEVFRSQRPGHGPGRARRPAPDLFLLGPAARRRVPGPPPRRRPQGRPQRPAPGDDRRLGRSPGRPRRPRRRLPQGRLAPDRRSRLTARDGIIANRFDPDESLPGRQGGFEQLLQTAICPFG